MPIRHPALQALAGLATLLLAPLGFLGGLFASQAVFGSHLQSFVVNLGLATAVALLPSLAVAIYGAWRRRWPLALGALGALLVVLAASALFLVWGARAIGSLRM